MRLETFEYNGQYVIIIITYIKRGIMDSLEAFMRETYIIKPDNRITVKEIYEDFRAWIIAKFGISIWNNITQRQVYAALKELPNYAYVRYREGFCLKGIAYKPDAKETKTTQLNPIIDTKEVSPHPSPYLTLNISPISPQVLNQIPTFNNITHLEHNLQMPNLETLNIPPPIIKDVTMEIPNYKPVTLNVVRDDIIQGETRQEAVGYITRTVPRVPKIILPRAFQGANILNQEFSMKEIISK